MHTVDPTITNARVFDVPRAELFRAFSDPERLALWWGPEGFANTFEAFDFRTGGEWRLVMEGPDGARFTMRKHFVEIVPEERIVLRHDQGEHSFLMTMTYETQPGGTRLEWRMTFDSPAEAERVRAIVEEANEQNFDRLGEVVARQRRG